MLCAMPTRHVYNDRGIHHAKSIDPSKFHPDFSASRCGHDRCLLRKTRASASTDAGTCDTSASRTGTGASTCPRASRSTRRGHVATRCRARTRSTSYILSRRHADGRPEQLTGKNVGLCG